MTDSTTTGSEREFGPWQYVTTIRVKVERERIEQGYSLDCLDDRVEGEIESETVFRGFQQEVSQTLAGSLPVIDTEEMPATATGVDRREELLEIGLEAASADSHARCGDFESLSNTTD